MTQEEALKENLTLVCCGCGNVHEAPPDGAIQDPFTGEWFGVLDIEPGACQQCGGTRFKYDR